MANLLDPNRAQFVRREYRDYIVADASVNARFNGNARIITVVTNLNKADSLALANKTLAANKQMANAFEIVFDGTFGDDSLVGQCPTALVTLPKYKIFAKLMRIYRVRTDYDKNITTVEVRG